MNRLINIFINRIYHALVKVDNPSPFIGSVILLSIVIFLNLINIMLIIKSNGESYLIFSKFYSLIFLLILFVILYKLKMKSKEKIINLEFKNAKKINLGVSLIIIITLILFVHFSNINREKIFNKSNENNSKHKNESLEGR